MGGRLIYFIFTLILISNFCSGQPSVINITKTTMGASKQNWGVAYDTIGYLYFANNNGLLENFGDQWKLYKLPDNLTVRSVNVDINTNKIYTGAYQEFGYWQRNLNGELVYHSLSKSLPKEKFNNDEIWRIVFLDGKIYFQSFFNIFIYYNDSIKVITLNSNMVFLLKARNRLFIQAEQKGLYEIINDEFCFVPGSEFLNYGLVRSILPFEENKVLIGSGTEGLFIYNDREFIEWQSPIQQLIKDKQINNGFSDGSHYYMGTIMNGLYMFDTNGENILNYNAGNYLQNNTVLGITKNNDCNVWICLDRGIDILNSSNPFYIFKTEKNTLGSVYSAILYNDKIYIATNRGVYFNNFSNKNMLNLDLNGFKEVQGIKGQTWDLKAFNNQLLCGNNDGSYIIDGSISKQISQESGGYSFRPMTHENKRYLIQSTYQHLVLYEFKSNTWEEKHVFEELREPFIEIELGEDRYLWASHYLKGVYRLQLSNELNKIEAVNFYSTNKGLPSKYNNRIFKIGNRIVFTTQNGIYTYDDLNDTIIPFSRINKETGEFNFSQKIISIGHQKYWFLKDNKAALFQINQDSTELIILYDLNNYNLNLVEQYENIIPINDSLSLGCLENGFILLSNYVSYNNNCGSKVFFTKISYINNNKGGELSLLPLVDTLVELEYGNIELKFNFSTTNQINKHIEYQYKLLDMDTSWTKLGKNGEITFHHLKWGNYRLKIRSVLNHELVLPEIIYQFLIKTPWYYTRLALAMYFVFVIFIIVGIVYFIKYYYRKKKEDAIRKYDLECQQKSGEERLKNEQIITNLKNENLQNEIAHKSKELAISAMSLIKKNELLLHIKEEIINQKNDLGIRFPDKYYKSLISMIDTNINSSYEWEIFETNFNQTHNNLFKRLKERMPDLTPSDLRLCAFLRLNLTSKEIAPLLGISVRGVETHRYRLRKKFNMDSDDNLFEFLIQD